MSTLNSTFTKADSLVSVTLHHSTLSKDGENYGKVTRNTVTLENLIAAIVDENRGLDPFLVQHSAILLQQQIIKMLQQGNAVNILDLGSLYISLKGTIKGDKPTASDLPDFSVKFTPSTLVNEAVSNLVVDKIVIADSNPQISVITNTWNGKENTLSPGKLCRITGSRLKLGGDFYVLSLLTLKEDESIDTSVDPFLISLDKVTKNTPSTLEFYVPSDLPASGKYTISIATSYISKTQSRKTPVTTFSSAVTVEE